MSFFETSEEYCRTTREQRQSINKNGDNADFNSIDVWQVKNKHVNSLTKRESAAVHLIFVVTFFSIFLR